MTATAAAYATGFAFAALVAVSAPLARADKVRRAWAEDEGAG